VGFPGWGSDGRGLSECRSQVRVSRLGFSSKTTPAAKIARPPAWKELDEMERKGHEDNLVSILVAGSIASAQIHRCHPGRMFPSTISLSMPALSHG
jgi:hypothetical protein